MYAKVKSIIFFFALFLLGACSITKRIHNPGWHVEWKSTLSSSKETEQVVTNVSMTERQVADETTLEQKHEEVNGTSENSNFQETTTLSDHEDQLVDQSLQPVQEEPSADGASKLDKEKNTRTEEVEEPDARKIHPLALSALVFLILSIPTLGLMLPLTIVLAILALNKILKAPKLWRGRTMALTVLFIALLPLFILIIALVLINGGFSIM
jgi:hypothetical protein